MPEINWNLLQVPDIGGNALAAFERGQEQGRRRKAEEAFANYATNPDDPNALNALAQYDPKFVVSTKQQMAEMQAKQAEKQRGDMLTMGKLLAYAKDPVTYQQARQAAQRFGLDVSQAPEQYDPNWVGETKLLVDAFNKDGGQSLTNAAKQVKELGYDINTPEGKVVLAQIINANLAKPYVDSDGNQRLYTGFNVQPAPMAAKPTPQPAPQQPTGQAREAFTAEQLRGLVSGLGREGAARYLQKHGMPVQIATAEDYDLLPPGQPYIDPNGVSRVKGK